ncbi:GNAT family N-acetyltransferase [Fundicoccus culcitae]|uniref:GNAT family N-acetyltransferase n=1 Tax=Fundicoccus culcitae TaxID=2969821 RepID=A0ABY5P3C5_9LACT|nr:GNAT family N-acetyltransferase [Fundicoccus culcitae]UUX33115.1 GNAT family N-acetyltransferase [Fundicoccus culcitae]
MELQRVHTNEFTAIQLFYHQLIEMMEGSPYLPGWEKDIYPSDEMLHDALNKHELYAVEINGTYVAAMIMNHDYNEGYKKANWAITAKDNEVTVIHALGILPTHQGQGLAKFLVQEAITRAQQNHQKAIRLDVLASNLPAHKLYTSLGFKLIDTVQMFYEDTGWTDYLLYEYVL